MILLIFISAQPFLKSAQSCDTASSFLVAHVAPSPPLEVVIPADFVGVPFPFFHDFSWRAFVACNWPANLPMRGVPNSTMAFASGATVRVWETWKSDEETFLDGRDPGAWDDVDSSPQSLISLLRPDALQSEAVVAFLAPKRRGEFKLFGLNTDEPNRSSRIRHYNQAGFGDEVGALVAQDGEYVRYEIRYNEIAYTHIRDNALYIADNLPATGQTVFPAGSVIVKAAWRVFPEGVSDEATSGFYTSEALLLEPSAPPRIAKVGLVGLHIISRTPLRREWVWTSFEHVTNVDGPTPTFANPAFGAPFNQLESVVNETHPPKAAPRKTNVRRVKPLDPCAEQANSIYHSAIGASVWQQYRLILTQWAVDPASDDSEFVARFGQGFPAGAGAPFPMDSGSTIIANPVLETTSAFQAGISCMNCHFAAGANATEFVWSLGLRAHRGASESLTLKFDGHTATARALFAQ